MINNGVIIITTVSRHMGVNSYLQPTKLKELTRVVQFFLFTYQIMEGAPVNQNLKGFAGRGKSQRL